MKLVVLRRHSNSEKDYVCRGDEREHIVDLFTDSQIPSDITDAELIGKTVEADYLYPYIEIASKARLS